jgi:Fe-S cluster biosynthesis and repair protein YggX
LRTYEDSAWRKFYVFDVIVEDAGYIPYPQYQLMLEKYSIDYIPPICRVENPTMERLVIQLEKNTYLIKDGHGAGEGIVIKNYEYTNKYGRQTWAKLVRNEYKANHNKSQITDVKDRKQIELAIVEKYITAELVEKEFAKIKNDFGWSSKMIPMLLGKMFHCLVSEECWNFVKEHKNPVIDFKKMNQFVIMRVKQVKPEIF